MIASFLGNQFRLLWNALKEANFHLLVQLRVFNLSNQNHPSGNGNRYSNFCILEIAIITLFSDIVTVTKFDVTIHAG